MARVARIERTGGPEVIEWVDVDLPDPGPGEVRYRSMAVGLNFIDTYYRGGLYPAPLPSGLGSEAAGVVEAVGPGVDSLAVGDRVSTFGPETGAYATERNFPAARLFKLPECIDYQMAAAVTLKGCTAEFLIERCARVQPGWTVLVHSAAGGVGQLLVQWLHHIGATVIGTVGHEEKAAVARAAGAHHVILYKEEDVADRVRELTEGKGVPVVFDGVGKAMWEASLKSTARRGLIISYGNASGPVEGVRLATLNQHGSLFATRPKLFDYYTEAGERNAGARRLWDLIASGALTPKIGQRFLLEEAAEAHAALEAGTTQGSTVLLP